MKDKLSPLQIAAVNCPNNVQEVAQMISDHASELCRENIRELNEAKRIIKNK